jgi:hypothetical protein
MDAAAAAAGRGGPAPPRCARAETDSEDAVATTSSPHSAEAAGAAEQGNGAPAPVADAADVEGVDGIRIRRRPVTGPPVHYVGPFQFRLENEGNTPRNILERIVWDKEAEVSQARFMLFFFLLSEEQTMCDSVCVREREREREPVYATLGCEFLEICGSGR